MTLATALASSTALLTDNTGDILTYFVAIAGAILILVLGKKALFWAVRKIVSLFNQTLSAQVQFPQALGTKASLKNL